MFAMFIDVFSTLKQNERQQRLIVPQCLDLMKDPTTLQLIIFDHT